MNERSPCVERNLVVLPTARCVTTVAWPVVYEDFFAQPHHRFAQHAHESLHVCLVIDGTLLERDGRRRHRLANGSGRISPAGDAHELAILDDRPLRCLVLSLAPECLGDTGGTASDSRRYIAGPGVTDLAGRLLGELRVLDDSSPISLEMLALEAVALTSPNERIDATPSWLRRVRERVLDDLRSVPSLEELARDAGVSRAYLARTFKGRYGLTIGQFVRSQRLDTARRLILQTEMPLASIAYEAGFADQSHMTRLVGSRFGLPPGRLRALS